jgi:hypothetical protein
MEHAHLIGAEWEHDVAFALHPSLHAFAVTVFEVLLDLKLPDAPPLVFAGQRR